MANIASYLEQINNARYGKDVRSSIHDSIKAMNDQIETDVMAEITTAKTTALGAISSAQTTATNAIATDKGTALSAISSAKSDATGQIATDKKDATDQIATDKAAAITDIEAKRVSSLASIPDDYTALGNSVNQLKEDLVTERNDIDANAYNGYVSVRFQFIDGGYIDRNNGNLIAYNNWEYTDFIDISKRELNSIYVESDTTSDLSNYNGFYNSNKEFIKKFDLLSGEITNVPESAKYVRMSVKKGASAKLSLYCVGYNQKINDVSDMIDKRVDVVLKNLDVESYMIQSTSPRNANFNDQLNKLAFIHFSDVHTKQENWNRIVEYANEYKEYISFAIHSGDYVGNSQTQYVDLYANGLTPQIPIYNAVGNHDTYTDNSGTTRASKADTYNKLFNHQSNWHATFMDGENSMTYFVDFPSSKIRLIVLDNYYDQSAQNTWLSDRLNGTLVNGFSVITVMHEVSRRIIDKLETGFQTLNNYESLGGNGGSATGVERISVFDATIADYKSRGGKHIANLVGHEHSDMIGYTNTGVLNIAVESATNNVIWCDARREAGTKTFDAFNVMSVDTNVGVFSIVRIGDNCDNYGRPRNVLSYDYINKRILSNF